jgi:hypothetical protein
MRSGNIPTRVGVFHSPLILKEEMEIDGWAYQLMPHSHLTWSPLNYTMRTTMDEQGKMKQTTSFPLLYLTVTKQKQKLTINSKAHEQAR